VYDALVASVGLRVCQFADFVVGASVGVRDLVQDEHRLGSLPAARTATALS